MLASRAQHVWHPCINKVTAVAALHELVLSIPAVILARRTTRSCRHRGILLDRRCLGLLLRLMEPNIICFKFCWKPRISKFNKFNLGRTEHFKDCGYSLREFVSNTVNFVADYFLWTVPSPLACACAPTMLCLECLMGGGRSRERARARTRAGANRPCYHYLGWPAAFDGSYSFLRLSMTSPYRAAPRRPRQDAPPVLVCKNPYTFCVSRESAAAHRAVPCSPHGGAPG